MGYHSLQSLHFFGILLYMEKIIYSISSFTFSILLKYSLVPLSSIKFIASIINFLLLSHFCIHLSIFSNVLLKFFDLIPSSFVSKHLSKFFICLVSVLCSISSIALFACASPIASPISSNSVLFSVFLLLL